MTEALLDLVPRYGLYLIGLSTFLSCLALPIPSSLIMLSAGAFVAVGDLAMITTAGGAFAGAVLGDQAGYLIGARGGASMRRLSGHRARVAALMSQASDLSACWGGPGVFLSRWLFSPLGPYMNFVAGAAGMAWPRFALWGAMGEAVWVALYVGLGYSLATQIEAVGAILGNLSGALAAGAVTVGLGLWLRAILRAEKVHHTS